MTRRILPLLLLLAACGTPAPVVPWPEPPPPPVVVDPPPEQPPVQPPATPPADVDAALARIVLGGTLADAEAALGPAQRVPGQGPTAASARWTVGSFIVIANLDAAGKVTGKGAVALGENP